MSKGIILLALCSMLRAPCSVAEAQQPTKIPRIAVLIGSSLAANAVRIEAFLQGLRELGYEGKNIGIEFRSAEGKFDRLPELAAEIVRLKVDVIVTTGPIVNPPAKEATSSIPNVMAFDNDPVGNGLVASLARPGGNITGLSNIAPEISGKQLEAAERSRSAPLPHRCLRKLQRTGEPAILEGGRDRC